MNTVMVVKITLLKLLLKHNSLLEMLVLIIEVGLLLVINNKVLIQYGQKAANTRLVTLTLTYSNTNYYFNIRCLRTNSTQGGYSWYRNKKVGSIECLEIDETGFWFTIGY